MASPAKVDGSPSKRNFVIKKKAKPSGPQDEKELTEKFKNMSSNTKNKKQAKRVGRNKEAIETLLESLNRNPKFTKMVEYSVECLGNLAVDKASIEEMIDEGVLDSLQKVLKLNPYNEKIQRIINRALKSFMVDEQTTKKVLDKMTAKPMIHSLNKHVEKETIESTTSTMATMMKYNPTENVATFVREGAIPAVASIINNNGENEKVMASAVENMNIIAKESKENAQAVMESNCVEAILTGLSEFPDNEVYVLHSVALFGHLARASPESLEKLQRLGAVDIIVAALEMHPDNEDILQLGSHALAAMAGEDDIGGALSVAAGNNMNTARAISKISSLLLVPENVDFMIKNQGIGWLVAALKGVVGQDGKVARNILQSGTRALQRLAMDEAKIYQLMQQGGVKLLLSIMGNHATDEEVATGALKALTSMVTRKENAQFIQESGGIEASQAVLAQHPESRKVAKVVEQFIQALAKHPEIVPKLIEKDAHKSVVEILSTHGQDPQIARLGINTLGRMAVNEEHMKSIAEAGGMAALVNVLRSHPEDLAIAKQTMLMMESAALVPENIEPLRAAGAVDAVLATLEQHPDDQGLQAIGSKLVARMAGDVQLEKAVKDVSGNVAMLNTGNIDDMIGAVKSLGHLALVDDNLDYLIRAGSVDALIAAFVGAMKQEPSAKRSDIITTSAAGLLRLTADADATTAIVNSSSLKKILQAALADPANEELAEMATELAAVAAGDATNIERMIAEDQIEDIVHLAQAHAVNEKALSSAARSLGLIAQHTPAAVKRMLEAGAGEVCVEALFANLDNPEGILDCLAVMKTFTDTGDEGHIQKIVDAGAIDAILEAMRKHPANTDVQKACMSALCSLLISETIANTIGEKGGIPLCIKPMRQHYKDQDLEEVDMVLCDSLASSDANKTMFLDKSLGTVDLVKWVAGKYQANNVIEEAAANLLASLTPPEKKQDKHDMQSAGLELKSERVQLNEVSAKALVAQMLASAPGSEARTSILVHVNTLISGDSHDAKMLLTADPFPALSAIMKQDEDNEAIFHAASTAFLSLLELGGADTMQAVVENPIQMEVMCNIMKASEKFAKTFEIKNLQKAISAVCAKKLKPVTVKALLAGNPFHSLMNILSTSEDPQLLANSAKLLGKLSNDPDAIKQIIANANLRELINAMRRAITNEEFLKYGVFLLGNFANQAEALKSQIGIEGGIQLIMQIMEMYPDNADLIENCGFALAALSYHEAVNCSFITACKGIPILCATMRNFPESTDLLEHCVIVLTNLCHNNDPNKESIVQHDGPQVVVDVVLANFDCLDLVSACFRCLGNLCNNKHNIESVVKAGAVQGLVAGMTVHADELDIITIAVRVLSAMAAEFVPQNMVVMADEGAVQAVVEVLQNYPTKTELEIAATQCLINLAKYPPNAAMIVKQGGVEASMEAAKQSRYDPKIVLKTVRLNLALTAAKDDLALMIRAGCVPGTMAILKAHGKARPVVGSGLLLIGKLCYSSEAAVKVAEGDTIPGVLALCKLNITDPGLIEEGFKTLNLLSRSEQNAIAMCGASMTMAVAVFQAHLKEAAAIRTVFQFLGNLFFHKLAGQMVESKGPEIVGGILGLITGHYIKDASVIVRGCKALENLAFAGPECKRYLTTEGTMQGMNTIKTKCVGMDDAIQAAIRVIEALQDNQHGVDLDFQDLAPRIEKHRDAKDIFGKTTVQEKKLSRDIRNMLISGALLIKHSKTAAPRMRHVYVDQDLKFLVWKDPKEKKLDPKNKMKVFKIKSIERGRCTPQLQRQRFGKFYAKEECAFSVTGRERTVDLEAESEDQALKWIHALETLIAYERARRLEKTAIV
eukprot:gb/GEZN01000200.1/.p1 GENE.gb/GEZN01000200.1/~~gb/GEZN01000200.1/.p1  ORF type:complete len:1836 (+),score=291.92 gb/GEZN01000200.1/:78-5585(+)